MAMHEKMVSTPEYALFKQYIATKDEKIRNELIDRYTYIAEIIARRFCGKGIDYDDLYQVACLGLLYAVERFNPDMGVKFTTFATPTISGEIKRYFRDKGNFIRIPRRLYEIFTKADRIRTANVADTPAREAVTEGLPRVVSIEQEILENRDIRLGHVLGKTDDGFLMVEDRDFIDRCMETLSEEERRFIHKRYYDEQSQKQIAAGMGVSQMQISRMERKVLKKLKALYFNNDYYEKGHGG